MHVVACLNESAIKPWEFATSCLPWHVKEANRISISLYCLPYCWCLLNGCGSIQEPQHHTPQGSSPWSDKVSVRPVHNSEASSADRIAAESTAASRHACWKISTGRVREGLFHTCKTSKKKEQNIKFQGSQPPKTANVKFLRRVQRRNMPTWLCREKTKHQHSWRNQLPEICSTPADRLCRHHHNSLQCRKPDFCFSCASPRSLSSNKSPYLQVCLFTEVWLEWCDPDWV